VGQASRDLARIAQRPQLTFRDRFRHREGVPTEDVEVFVDQRRQPRRILVPNHITFFAQFELEMMLERQLEGIAKAQAAGKYRGRKPIAMERQAEVRRLAATGMAKARIALELKIGEATVYRILARDREQAHPASSV
jgi:DNA invertase Pin-like site-specific DNA recombinase